MKYKYAKFFKESSIRLDQSSRDGKTIVSTRTLSDVLDKVATFAEEVEQIDLRLKALEFKDRK